MPLFIQIHGMLLVLLLTTYIHEYIKKEWKDVINRSILEAIYLKMRNRNISFQHVYGHKGITFNT